VDNVASAQRRAGRCLIIGSPRRKVSLGRQFTRKNPPRPAAAQAGWIITGRPKLWPDETSGGQSNNVETFYGARDILIKETYQISDYFYPGGFFMGELF